MAAQIETTARIVRAENVGNPAVQAIGLDRTADGDSLENRLDVPAQESTLMERFIRNLLTTFAPFNT